MFGALSLKYLKSFSTWVVSFIKTTMKKRKKCTRIFILFFCIDIYGCTFIYFCAFPTAIDVYSFDRYKRSHHTYAWTIPLFIRNVINETKDIPSGQQFRTKYFYLHLSELVFLVIVLSLIPHGTSSVVSLSLRIDFMSEWKLEKNFFYSIQYKKWRSRSSIFVSGSDIYV